jgi:Transposase DDE domain/Insertion element 4 transposase N-terminal
VVIDANHHPKEAPAMPLIGSPHATLARHAPNFDPDILTRGSLRGKILGALAAHPPPWHQRSGPLHPVLVMWLCLGMALYRHLSIASVFAHLMDALRRVEPGLALRPVTEGALAHARTRLGVACLRELFEQVAREVQPEPSFHGLRVWALDGTVLSVPDTPSNEETFGRHIASRGRTAFPQLRLVTLCSARTRGVRAAAWCRYEVSETKASKPLLSQLGPGDLLVLDRGLGCIEVAAQLHAQGGRFLYRVRSVLKVRLLYVRGAGDCLVRAKTFVKEASGARRKIEIEARMITYRVAGGPPVRLLTDIVDEAVTPTEIARLYHERWDVEIAFDEMKTHLGSRASGAVAATFRGRSGPMVQQEIWATLTAYNLVRGVMADAGRVHRIDPRLFSFVAVLETVRLALPGAQSPRATGTWTRRVQLVEDLIDCILDRSRRPRVSPRAVRQRERQYRRKRRGEQCVNLGAVPAIALEVA